MELKLERCLNASESQAGYESQASSSVEQLGTSHGGDEHDRFEGSAFERPEFESVLLHSRPYRRTGEREGDDLPLRASTIWTGKASMLSGLSLSEISVIAVIGLPVDVSCLTTRKYYDGRTSIPSMKPAAMPPWTLLGNTIAVTSTLPLAEFRYRIIHVLEMLGVDHVEHRKGFRCRCTAIIDLAYGRRLSDDGKDNADLDIKQRDLSGYHPLLTKYYAYTRATGRSIMPSAEDDHVLFYDIYYPTFGREDGLPWLCPTVQAGITTGIGAKFVTIHGRIRAAAESTFEIVLLRVPLLGVYGIKFARGKGDEWGSVNLEQMIVNALLLLKENERK